MGKGKKWAIVKKWCCNRLKEKSTWLAVIGILTAFCICPFDEITTGYVATFLGSLGSLIGILWQDKERKRNANKKVVKKKTKCEENIVRYDDSDDCP